MKRSYGEEFIGTTTESLKIWTDLYGIGGNGHAICCYFDGDLELVISGNASV